MRAGHQGLLQILADGALELTAASAAAPARPASAGSAWGRTCRRPGSRDLLDGICAPRRRRPRARRPRLPAAAPSRRSGAPASAACCRRFRRRARRTPRPACARCCWRTCSKRARNSSAVTSSCCHSIDTGHQDGAVAHQVGGAWILATVLALPPTMYWSMPNKANGTISRPRITVATSRGLVAEFLQHGQSGLGVSAAQSNATAHAGLGTAPGFGDRPTEKKEGAVSGAFWDNGGADGTRTRDLRRDRPAF